MIFRERALCRLRSRNMFQISKVFRCVYVWYAAPLYSEFCVDCPSEPAAAACTSTLQRPLGGERLFRSKRRGTKANAQVSDFSSSSEQFYAASGAKEGINRPKSS
eukprot:2474674-Pyramimonas_sp.AAC.1